MSRSATPQERREYIAKFSDVIIQSTIGTNLLPSVVMAQAILEGNAGISSLAKKYSNHFGVKAQPGDGWKGLTVTLNTDEQTKAGKVYTTPAKFRHYPSSYDSIKDHNKFVHAKRYSKLNTVKTPREQLQVLKDNGYATDVRYVEKCMSIIAEWKLTKLDDQKNQLINKAQPYSVKKENVIDKLIDGFKIDSLKQ